VRPPGTSEVEGRLAPQAVALDADSFGEHAGSLADSSFSSWPHNDNPHSPECNAYFYASADCEA